MSFNRPDFEIHWTDHARERAAQRGIDISTAEDLLDHWQDRRRPNDGSADWRLTGRDGTTVIFDLHREGHRVMVRVVTVWKGRGDEDETELF